MPVPWPQRYDPTSDIFGWPYVIVPRLPGLSLDDRTARRSLSPDDQLALARALGRGLARLHVLRWPVAGEIDANCGFAAYPAGFLRHIVAEVDRMRSEVQTRGALTTQDQHWIAILIEAACAERSVTGSATYVHGDFKLDNLVVDHAPRAPRGLDPSDDVYRIGNALRRRSRASAGLTAPASWQPPCCINRPLVTCVLCPGHPRDRTKPRRSARVRSRCSFGFGRRSVMCRV